MILQIIHGITLSMYVRLKQDCFVKLNERKKEKKKRRKEEEGLTSPGQVRSGQNCSRACGINLRWSQPRCCQSLSQGQSAAVIDSGPSRSQRVPPRKAFTQKEFLRVVPVRPFICEGKTCFHKQNKKTVNCQLLSYQRHRSHANYSVLFGISRDTPQYKSIICGIESVTNCKKCISFEEIYYL